MSADQMGDRLEEVRAARFAAECELPRNVFHAKILNARKTALGDQERALRRAWQLAKYGRTGF